MLILLLTCRQDHISVMRKSSKWNYKRKPILFAFNLSDLSIQAIQKKIFGLGKLLHIITYYKHICMDVYVAIYILNMGTV